jgi:membrane-associated protein
VEPGIGNAAEIIIISILPGIIGFIRAKLKKKSTTEA